MSWTWPLVVLGTVLAYELMRSVVVGPQVTGRHAATAGYDPGTTMDFIPRIHEVAIQPERLRTCAERVHGALSRDAPLATNGCKNCEAVARLRAA